MTDPVQNKAKYDAQTGQLYEAIGKCVVKFELVCFHMHQGITLILGTHGLQNQRLTQVLLADLTAAPLKSIFQALVAEVGSLSLSDKSVCDKIFSRIQKLIERRNDIIHSTWFVGWASPEDTDFSAASGHKFTRGKQGANLKQVTYVAEDFAAFATECDIVGALVHRLYACILADWQITKNFVIDNAGNVACPIS